MTLADYLAQHDAEYDPDHGLVGHAAQTPGYHTTLPDGTRVHSTVANLDYAVACLASGELARAARAADVLARVLDHQDTDSEHATYGIWPWFTDEPLTQMSPPDWNWADFCGARLAVLLTYHTGALPAELVERTRAALRHAANAIVRRNVGPGYTNIAIMGATVTAAAGELLDDAALLDYARARMRRNVAHTEFHGGFNEYNSPTYTMVALAECDRALELVRDESVRADAARLREVAWTTIAEHWHPATGEWAGPHSRCYSDRLPDSTRERLRVLLGAAPDASFDFVRQELCPAHLRARFQALPEPVVELQRTFVRAEDGAPVTVGTTWLCETACLGSINHDTLWVQRRPVLGYWLTAGPAAVLRLRCLKDGRDFAAGDVTSRQSGARVESTLAFAPRTGDHHCSLDRPADGLFWGSTLAFRYELSADDARVEADDDGWRLAAGGWQARVTVGEATFEDAPVRWTAGSEAGWAWVEAVLYTGERRSFDWPRLASARLAANLLLEPLG